MHSRFIREREGEDMAKCGTGSKKSGGKKK